MPTEPVRPDEIAKPKQYLFPSAVVEAFNELIAEKFVDGRSVFKQREVVARMVAKGLKLSEIDANDWLDVEPMYEQTGWRVEYNESYPATFTFSA